MKLLKWVARWLPLWWVALAVASAFGGRWTTVSTELLIAYLIWYINYLNARLEV